MVHFDPRAFAFPPPQGTERMICLNIGRTAAQTPIMEHEPE